ncbi:MAG: hypothetical protein GY822_10280 [Deltaproteobacteria bacterium]|nr:hypothetical protein [Deltaproteobacteria bacterium]
MRNVKDLPFHSLSKKARGDRIMDTAIVTARAQHRSPLAGDIRRLHTLLTMDHADRDPGYLRNAGLRRAYLGYYAPKNALKIAVLLQQLEAEGHLPKIERMLDLGCGPLSATLGAAVAISSLRESVCVDLAKKSMEEGRDLLRKIGHDLRPYLTVASLTTPNRWEAPRNHFDLVVLANVLNEMGDPRKGIAARMEVVNAALDRLNEKGVLLIIEPATQVHSRGLMRLRDELVDEDEDGKYSVVAPCCAGTPNCPLLERGRDWCHTDLEMRRTKKWEQLEKEAEMSSEVYKTSYLVIRRRGVEQEQSELEPMERGLRVIGGVMRGQRQGRGSKSNPEGRYVCTIGGRKTLQAKTTFSDVITRMPRGSWLEALPADTALKDFHVEDIKERSQKIAEKKANRKLEEAEDEDWDDDDDDDDDWENDEGWEIESDEGAALNTRHDQGQTVRKTPRQAAGEDDRKSAKKPSSQALKKARKKAGPLSFDTPKPNKKQKKNQKGAKKRATGKSQVKAKSSRKSKPAK